MISNDFYKNIISLFNGGDTQFNTTLVGTVEYSERYGFVEVINLVDSIPPTPFSKTPAISCLIFFTLFDAFLESKHHFSPDMKYKDRYNALTTSTDICIIEKECYRLIRMIRNGFVHHINSIILHDGLFRFNYPIGTKTLNLDISKEKIIQLYSIILFFVQGYAIKTKGHIENVLCTLYNELKKYIDLNGNFTMILKSQELLDRLP